MLDPDIKVTMFRTLKSIAAAFLAASMAASLALAQDIYQPNFTVPNTSILLPHPRIAPEQPLWNAYQNPLTAPHRTEPWIRDNDGDGIPNAFDYDDNRSHIQPPTVNQMLLPPKD